MQVEHDKTERVALFVSPQIREMLNEVARANDRGQKDQLEHMIKKIHQRLKSLEKLRVVR